jgi:hypothetical protein
MKIHSVFKSFALGVLLLVVIAALSAPSAAQIGVGISVRIGPPALPVYVQPICPGPGFLWTPGYWAWSDDDGYYWVPGTWVEAPEAGFLWTPGYWGWNDGVYVWNAGYWGPEVGFYGGINYGFGYFGTGFGGGEWRGGRFFYNTAVMRVNTVNVTNVYVNKTVIVNNTSHVAFNGPGGVQARPTAHQEAYMHEHHTPPLAAQTEHQHAASQNRALFASTNHGRPAVAATAKPGEFSGRGVVAAKAAGGTYHAPAMSPKEARSSAGANRAEEKRTAENRAPEGKTRTNASHAAESRSGTTHPSTSRTESRPAEKHPSETRAANAPKSATHSSTPKEPKQPKETATRGESSRPASKPKAENAPKSTAHKESAPKPATKETRTEPAPRRESAPKASEPRASKPAPPPKHETAPKPSEPKASVKPAPAPRPAPAEKHESAPKPEHKGR